MSPWPLTGSMLSFSPLVSGLKGVSSLHFISFSLPTMWSKEAIKHQLFSQLIEAHLTPAFHFCQPSTVCHRHILILLYFP